MEGKKKYFAIILFLFLGLMIFTFANQDDDSLKDTGDKKGDNKTEEKIKKDKDEDTGSLNDILTVEDDGNQVGVITRNKDTNTIYQTTDDGYEKALQAVLTAEKNLTTDSVNSAQDLVDQVTDQSKKEELENRLQNVKDAINAQQLVEKLENMVKEAASLTDMNNSRDYRSDEKIVELVDKLTNKEVKEDLQSRLKDLASLLDDTKGPSIDGIDNNTTTKDNVTLSVTDDNEVTIKVVRDGESIEVNEEDLTFTDEGVYVVTVVDAAYNETTLTFTIDKTDPVIEVYTYKNKKVEINEDGNYYVNCDAKVYVTDTNIDTITKNGKPYVSGTKFGASNNQKVEIIAIDKAGNEVKAKLVFDKAKPKATVEYDVTEPTNQNVTATLKAKENIETPDGWTKVDDKTFTKEYKENTTETVTITDQAGNQSKVEVKIENIDKDIPTVVNVVQEYQTKQNGRIKVTVEFSEEVKVKGQSSYQKTYVTYVYRTKTITVNFTDKAGNSNSISIDVDKTAPKITGIENGVYTSDNVTLEIEESSSTTVEIKKDNETISKDDLVFTDDGTYEVTVKDEVGNSTTLTFTIDKTLPEIKGVENGTYYNTDITPTINDKNIDSVTLNGEPYNGEKISEDGEYTLKATDKAGNEKEVTFTIDQTKPVPTITAYYNDDEGDEIKAGSITDAKNIIYIIEWPEDVVGEFTGKNFWYSGFDMPSTRGRYQDNNNKYRVKLWTLDGEENEATFTIYADAMKDKAGNTNDKVTFTVNVDRKSPEITGVEDGKWYNKEVTPVVTDKNIDSVTLNGAPYNGEAISEDGEYTLKATDKVGNEKEVTFTIDKAAPQVNVYQARTDVDKEVPKNADGKYYYTNSVRLDIKDANLASATYPDGTTYENNTATDKSGDYTITDKAGNKTVVSIVVDKTHPAFVLNKKKYTKTPSTIYFKEDVEVSLIETNLVEDSVVFKKNDESQKYVDGMKLEEEATYYLEATDKSGRTTKVTFVIDKTKPVITLRGLVEGTDNLCTSGGIIINDKNNFSYSYKKGDGEYGKEVWARRQKPDGSYEDTTNPAWNGDGTYTVRATDVAGNVEEVTYTVDSKAPSIVSSAISKSARETKSTDKTYATAGDRLQVTIVTNEKLADSVNPTIEIGGKELSAKFSFDKVLADGTYRYKFREVYLNDVNLEENKAISATVKGLKDEAGNTLDQATFTGDVIYDSKAPEMTLNYSNVVLKDNANVTIKKGDNINIDDVNNFVYYRDRSSNKNPGVLDPKSNHTRFNIGWLGEGEFTIKAIDLAGNSTTININQVEDINESLDSIKEGETIYLPDGNIDVSKLNNLPSGVTIIGGANRKVSTINGNLTINNENITLENVTVDGTLSVNSSNVTLNNVNATNTGSGALTIGSEKDGKTYENIVINGGNYTTSNEDAQGEGAVRIFNAKDISIHNLTTNGGIHLINYKGKTADISDNKIKFDYKGTTPFAGILITTDNQGDYTAQQLYENNEFDMDSLTNSYYVAIQDVDWHNIDVIQVGKYVEINSADGLRKLSENPSDYTGKIVVLTDDIDLSGKNWTPINGDLNKTVIDGKGHSIKNMTVEEEIEAGFIGFNASNVSIKNVTFDNANVTTTSTSNSYAGVVISKNYAKITLDNVNVVNSRVENHWQAGGLVGFAEGNGPTFVNCSIKDSYVGGENSSSGSLFGLGDVNVTVDGCTAENVKLYTDGLTWPSTQKNNNNFWVGHLYNGTLTVKNSTETNVEVVSEEVEKSVTDEATGSQKNDTPDTNNVTSYRLASTETFPYLSQPYSVSKTGSTITDKKIVVTSDDDVEFNEFLANSNYKPENVIWWAQFSCDTTKCVGFNEPGTNNKSAKVVEGRRGDASITMEAPQAKEGYKFVRWEKSDVKYSNMTIQGFEAIYEEENSNEEDEIKQTSLTNIMISNLFSSTIGLFNKVIKL